ncbi:MAG TPA: hypothetical protein VLC92_14470 [Rhodocyclaceae bacterium]|nr:hypothetical protein [Rhodocyclaceae bacterium]
MLSPDLDRVAETHFFLRPVLSSALKSQTLTTEGQQHFPGCNNYNEVWATQLSDKYFDMGTLIRAAASVETGLRDYYVQKVGHANLTQLRADPKYKQNIFQRVMPWSGKDGAIALFNSIGVDLAKMQDFASVQELVLQRHLYAHNLGVIDAKYMADLKSLTGQDISQHPSVLNVFPAQDVVWFEPLSRLDAFINAARSFLRNLQ